MAVSKFLNTFTVRFRDTNFTMHLHMCSEQRVIVEEKVQDQVVQNVVTIQVGFFFFFFLRWLYIGHVPSQHLDANAPYIVLFGISILMQSRLCQNSCRSLCKFIILRQIRDVSSLLPQLRNCNLAPKLRNPVMLIWCFDPLLNLL